MRLLLRLSALIVLSFTLLALVCMLTVIGATHRSIYAFDKVPQAEVALVLGASVSSDGSLSPVLRERADGAIRLYMAHKVKKILVSGDNSSVAHNEVYPVGKYLLSHGVPIADIFLDYAGFDTYSSMYRAKNVFGTESMVITSQAFHLPRALIVAHALGISAVGLNVSMPGEKYLQNSLREIPATAKAIFDLCISRIPLYVGQKYPVSGDGTATWVGDESQMVYFVHD